MLLRASHSMGATALEGEAKERRRRWLQVALRAHQQTVVVATRSVELLPFVSLPFFFIQMILNPREMKVSLTFGKSVSSSCVLIHEVSNSEPLNEGDFCIFCEKTSYFSSNSRLSHQCTKKNQMTD